MAFAAPLVPIVASIGGGSTAVGATLLASAALTVGAGVMSAKQSRAAGKMAQGQAEIDAKAEGDAFRNREIQRKRNLIRAISSQQAAAGAGGITFDGSAGAIAKLDIADAGRDSLIDNANTMQRMKALRGQGRAARISGNAQGTMSLLDTAARTTSSFARL